MNKIRKTVAQASMVPSVSHHTEVWNTVPVEWGGKLGIWGRNEHECLALERTVGNLNISGRPPMFSEGLMRGCLNETLTHFPDDSAHVTGFHWRIWCPGVACGHGYICALPLPSCQVVFFSAWSQTAPWLSSVELTCGLESEVILHRITVQNLPGVRTIFLCCA